MEHRLYYDSPCVMDWETDITDMREIGGKFEVRLSETAFYPVGGGQPSDLGFIDGIAVEDVFERDGGIIHILGKAPRSGRVSCSIDRERRLDLMQQHSGQHLLSAVLYKLYDCKTSSLHMGMDELSIDVAMAEMPAEMLTTVEDRVNAYIYKDLPVVTRIVTPEIASELTLRKTPPKEGDVRIVEITSIDRSPCCGTHVQRTGEIGIVKIVKTEKRGAETRVYFKCGRRALKDYQQKQDIVTGLVHLYRMSEGDVLAKTEALAAQLRNTQKELTELKDTMLKAEAKELAAAAASKVISRIFDDKSFADISTLAKYLIDAGDLVVILSSIPDKRLLFAHSGKFDVSCGKMLKESLAAYNGKGGGKDNWANGGFNTAEDIKRFQEFLLDSLGKKGIN
jgi:alanyl-tRNA synthetase